MIGQYLPQTNKKCYSVLQCSIWLFLPLFQVPKHSPSQVTNPVSSSRRDRRLIWRQRCFFLCREEAPSGSSGRLLDTTVAIAISDFSIPRVRLRVITHAQLQPAGWFRNANRVIRKGERAHAGRARVVNWLTEALWTTGTLRAPWRA